MLKKDSFAERRPTICYSNNSSGLLNIYWFSHLEGGREEPGCSYWHRIGRNGGLSTAIVMGEESGVIFWKWKKEEKCRPLFSITHRRVKMYRRKLVAEIFLNGLAEKRNF